MSSGTYPVSPTWGTRLAGFEGLRALACLLIIIVHTWGHSGAGQKQLGPGTWDWLHPTLSSGLTLFFTLSGFLLYRPFVTAILRETDAPRTSSYLRNRALRIVPAYWVIILVVALLAVATQSGSLESTGQFESVTNFLLNGLLLQSYTPDDVLTGIPPAWSLSVEVVFYLTLPLLAFGAHALAKGRTLSGRTAAVCAPAVLLLIVGMIGKLLATYPANDLTSWAQVLERSFLTKADLFAFGMLAAVVVSAPIQPRRVRFDAVWLPLLALAVAVAATGLLAVVDEPPGPAPNRFYPTAMALACGLLVLWVASTTRRRGFVRVLDSRVVVFAGMVSYSAYVWHWPLIFWLRSNDFMTSGSTGVGVNLLLVAGLTFALATVTYFCVEAPALRRKARTVGERERTPRPRTAVPRVWLAALSPAFRYDSMRQAYILRIGGDRWGPVLTPKR